MITIKVDRAGQPDREGLLRVSLDGKEVLVVRYHDRADFATGYFLEGGLETLLQHCSKEAKCQKS